MYTNLELGFDFDPFESDEVLQEETEQKDLSNIELPF
jgi:hypothetical protein